MARNAEGWKLKDKRGIPHVRFTHKGHRYEITTGTRDATEAASIAARIYSDVISGQVRKASTGQLAHPKMDLDELTAKWLVNIKSELKGKTPKTYLVYARTWKRHFDVLGAITSSSIGDYQRDRLTMVLKRTVVKERSALLRFLVWLVEKNYLTDVPLFPVIGKKVIGTKYAVKRRSIPQVALTRKWVDVFLGELDVRSKKHGFLIRPRFEFQWATGLRTEFVDVVNWDWVIFDEDGAAWKLRIPGEFDKNGKERTVPFSPRARKALAEAGEPVRGGVIFGRHDYRDHVTRAKAKLPAHLASEFTPYGLKHARITEWVRAGKNELGIQHLTGTKYALGRYAIASEDAAEDIVASD